MKVRSPARRCRAAAGRRRGRPAMRLKRFSTCLADTAFARREYKPLILAGQNREQGVRLQLSEVEEDIMQQMWEVDTSREARRAAAYEAAEREFYKGVRHRLIQAFASPQWLNRNQNLDDVELPEEEYQRVYDGGYPLFYLTVAIRRFGGDKVIYFSFFFYDYHDLQGDANFVCRRRATLYIPLI